MVRKKNMSINSNYKKIFFGLILLFFWVVSLLSDTESVFWFYLSEVLSILFWEHYKWIFSPVIIGFCLFLFKEKDVYFDFYSFIGFLFFFFSVTTIIGFFDPSYTAFFNLCLFLEEILWRNTILFSFLIIFILSLVILFRFTPFNFTKKVVSILSRVFYIKNNIRKNSNVITKEITEAKKTRKEEKIDQKKQELENILEKLRQEKESLAKAKQAKVNISNSWKKISIEKKTKLWSIFQKAEKSKNFISSDFNKWSLPSLNLLDDRWWDIVYDENEIRRKEIEIEEKLLQFKIEVDMKWYKVWPTVIQYRLKPKQWVKLQKIVNLKKDLTLALHARNIRIQAPIPWLWVVWIEVPNNNRQMVWLKEVIASNGSNVRKKEIPLALWKDVSWNIVVWDLVYMPHLLIAGQTGSWKSVWMNAFLISILYKFSPSELKIIMVDPKRVELSVYNWIPHLLTPVITNPEKAVNALKWCVAEMLRRYDLEASVNARNIKEYNAKVSKDKRLPYIVMVIDELADLMMSGMKKEVEGSIARIAQMARAVGMHLIVATQRPSVDVITWLIKANIPSRIAFTVASQVDSRTVIDKQWAEDLLGKWDMLYYPTWAQEPERIQWVYVETHEVEAVVNKLKLTIDPEMLKNMQDSSIVNGKSRTEGSILENYEWDQDEDPEIIEKAIQVVKDSRKWSTSLIQRKLWLGYARAAKVLDILEDLGVVGPANGSKPREVYVD